MGMVRAANHTHPPLILSMVLESWGLALDKGWFLVDTKYLAQNVDNLPQGSISADGLQNKGHHVFCPLGCLA